MRHLFSNYTVFCSRYLPNTVLLFLSCPTGAVPVGSHDGAGLRPDLRDRVVCFRVPERQASCRENRRYLPSVLRTALLAESLRLW